MIKTANTNNKKTLRNWQDYDECCLDISLFNRYQESEYLESTLLWINSRFKHCLLNLGDTLHRHNLSHQSPSIEVAHKESRLLGDDWLAKNACYFERLAIPFTLMRSDDWLEDKDFARVHEALWGYYYKDKIFQAVVREDIEGFVARKPDIAADIVRRSSLNYLIEETAADILLGSRGGVAHLYPGSRHACYWYLVEAAEHLPKDLRGLENSAFKRLSPSRITQSYGNKETKTPENAKAA